MEENTDHDVGDTSPSRTCWDEIKLGEPAAGCGALGLWDITKYRQAMRAIAILMP